MTKTQIIVIFGFLIAFGAGTVVGLRMREHAVVQAINPPPQERSWLRTELGLTPEQNDQMKSIWDALHSGGHAYEDRRRRLRDERDEAIAALLPPSAMGDYDKVLQIYADRMSQLSQERDKAFSEAVEKTRTILSADQRVKYEEFLKRRDPRGGPPGFGGPPAGGPAPGIFVRRPDSRPTSRPARR